VSEDPTEKLIRDFQDRITQGTYAGIYGLDDAGIERVMQCQADSCARAFVELYQISDDLDLDAFLEKMTLGGSSKIRIRRESDGAIIWEELHNGQCMCPLVTREVIPLEPELCRCAIHWLRMLVERHVKGPVSVELIDSVAHGSENCVFRVEIDDPSPPREELPPE
jgi:hypothetical protein